MPTRFAGVRVYRCELSVVGGVYRLARTQVSALDAMLVEVVVVTDAGVSGFGETAGEAGLGRGER